MGEVGKPRQQRSGDVFGLNRGLTRITRILRGFCLGSLRLGI